MRVHILTAGPFTLAGTVLAIKVYLSVGNCDRPTCKVVGEEFGFSQLSELAVALSVQSEILATQTEVMAKQMARVEVVEQTFRTPSTVRAYSEVVGHSEPATQARVVRQPLDYFMCGSPS